MSHKSPAHPARFRDWYLPVMLIVILLALAVRTARLDGASIFWDEGLHIQRAHRVIEGQVFVGFEVNKWLYPVVLAAFMPTGPEALWIARALSALMSLVSVAACIRLANLLSGGDRAVNRQTGLLAGLIYAMVPMAVFHERQALVDPMLAAFTSTSLVLAATLYRGRPRWQRAALLGVVLAAAVLTKLIGVSYLVVPLAAVVLAGSWRTARRGLVAASGAVALTLALLSGIYALSARGGGGVGDRFAPSLGNTLIPTFFTEQTQATLAGHLADVGAAATAYFGYPALILLLLSVVWLAVPSTRRAAIFVLVPAIALMALPVLTRQVTGTGRLPPRYLLINTAPLTVLVALSAQWLALQASKLGRRMESLALAAIALVLILPAAWFDVRLITDFSSAPLTADDRNEYLQSINGYTLMAAADDLLAAEGGNGKMAVLLDPVTNSIFPALVGPRLADFEVSKYADERAFRTLARWLGGGRTVYFLDRDLDPISASFPGSSAQAQMLGAYPPWSLQRLTSVEGALADAAYTNAIAPPEVMGESIDPFLAWTEQQPRTQPILAFPPGHGTHMAERTSGLVKPLSVGRWPLTSEAVNAAIDVMELDRHSRVEVALLDEAAADPDRALLLALDRRYYRLAESWYGLLHHVSYATGPAWPELTPLDARFADVIRLNAVAILDREVAPGGFIRLVLEWQSPVPVNDSFVVFIHLLDADGNLRAQRDSVPGNGLLPMTGWPPGEPVSERFAIALPADLLPGQYTMQIGLYHPTSLLRLPASGPEHGPDSVVLGRVQVQ